ncbi:TIGR03826 family flagellar region protein [Virgibacillus flavescens]|uniref:TIGR03826 family flagellar region protein n=1 Tax=Virgibacillus flavescens TaxID=1611422 RepID=UPI003D34F386
MGELANCTRCDELFMKTLRDVCKNCFEEEERAFKTVSTYLRQRKNRQATLILVEEETGVSSKLITKFIKEKRLLTSQFPKLGYPCDTCDNTITTGRICSTCSDAILSDLDTESEIEQRTERLSKKENENTPIFYSYKKD